MDFFNKLTKKAKDTYGVASKKTGELAKEAKLRMKMNENKSDINDLYQEIGKKVYEKHVLSEEINIKTDLEEECTKIDILSAEIETYLNQIRELKDKKQCPKCFNEIDLNANYCNHCGAKQEELDVNEEKTNNNTNETSEKEPEESNLKIDETPNMESLDNTQKEEDNKTENH